MANLDLNDVAVFVRVLQRGGFASAARELRVPTSTVSRTIARLEKTVGARLVQRTTRAVRPTAEGRELFDEVAPAVGVLERATRHVASNDPTPRGRLRVTAPPDLGATFIAGIVAAYVARYPEVAVELELTSRRVDLVAEGFDVAIRAGRLADSTLVARKIGEMETLLAASPAYLAKHAAPKIPAQLASHEVVLFRAPDGRDTWRLRGAEGEVRVDVKGRIVGDDFLFVLHATLEGAGISLLPRLICARDVSEGRLVRVLPNYDGGGAPVHFVYPTAKQVPAKVTAFRELVLEAYARGEATCRKSRPGRVEGRG